METDPAVVAGLMTAEPPPFALQGKNPIAVTGIG